MDSTQDSTPWIPDSSYWIPNYLKVGLGFRIPIVSCIRDSLTCIPDSTSKNFPDSGIWIPLHCTWGEIYKAKCQRNIFYSLSSSSPFPSSVVGLHVTSRRLSWWSRTKAFLSSGNITLFSWKFFKKKFRCIDHQHSRLVTCLQTKNPFPFFRKGEYIL